MLGTAKNALLLAPAVLVAGCGVFGVATKGDLEKQQAALEQRDREMHQLYGDKGEIAWGSQIRSYVLDDRRVKDHRTGQETGVPERVLDGDLQLFIEAELRRASMRTFFDIVGSIGKRYRRMDEVGTPFCITFDFDSLEDHAVTVRDRDTLKQDRIAIDKVRDYLLEKVEL